MLYHVIHGTHLTPGWREAIMIKCLAQVSYTSVTAGIRTHILLLTPELESGKLDRSATTLHNTCPTM